MAAIDMARWSTQLTLIDKRQSLTGELWALIVVQVDYHPAWGLGPKTGCLDETFESLGVY